MKTYYVRLSSLLLCLIAGAASPARAASATPTGTIDPVSGYLTTSATIKHSYTKIGKLYVQTAAGQTAYSANITVNGVSRRYVVLRPNPAPASAPMLLLLHPNSTAPENMANLTQVADYALTQGFWAVMPAAINGVWQDDPGTSNSDDVTFISSLIDTLSTQGVDATRVYAAGYSNGGFMSERLACELSTKIAAFGIDAATLHGTQASACASPSILRSKVYFLGTADNVVPYAGISTGTPNGLWSATDTMNFWVNQQKCGGVLSTPVPDIANDGTTVQQTQYTGCSAGTALQLYTIYNGGHAWPGGTTSSVGTTTQDIKATGLVWRFVSTYRR